MRSALFILTSLLFLSPAPGAEAQGGGGAIVLSTTLLEVEPRQRTATVSVANRTAAPQRYRISVVDRVMDGDGRVSDLTTAVERHRSASSWVIATPRSLRLEPGQSQTIRLLVRRPGDLSAGEYRAHLQVAQEPPAEIGGGLAEAPRDGGMQINIVTVYSTSIPIVFQHGEVDVSAAMSAARLDDAGILSLTVERRGNASFRGFARATAGDAPPLDLPITIYPEVDAVTRTYELGALTDAPSPLTLTLHSGPIPRPSEEVTSEMLGSIAVSR